MLITRCLLSGAPARTIGKSLGVSLSMFSKHVNLLENANHYGLGMLAGPIRALMSYYVIIGPCAVSSHAGTRSARDQVAEMSAGVSVDVAD